MKATWLLPLLMLPAVLTTATAQAEVLRDKNNTGATSGFSRTQSGHRPQQRARPLGS
jgi:hypothetical protein